MRLVGIGITFVLKYLLKILPIFNYSFINEWIINKVKLQKNIYSG